MRPVVQVLFTVFSIATFTACNSLRDSPKFKFDDGVYVSRLNGHKEHVYVENSNDSIIVYSLQKGWKKLSLKASSLPRYSYTSNTNIKTIRSNKYRQYSLDIDFLTMPIKFRPMTQSFPRQFSNNLNGTVYLGYRNDTYKVNYTKNPIGKISQKITHYGLSAGIITGVGGVAMNSWVTNNQISIEYDGVVWSKGVAIIMGVDKLTFGIVGGIDHLLDKNKNFWIYQGKPYLGLAVGLNLN